MNAVERSRKRRLLAGLSVNQTLALPNGQTITLGDAGRMLQGSERLLQVRWNVYASAYAAHVELVKSGQLSIEQARAFWNGVSGEKLRNYSTSLAKFPEAWAELERFSQSQGLGALPIVAVIVYSLIGAGATYGAIEIISHLNRVDYAKEERLKAQIELQREAIDRGLDPKTLRFSDQGGRSILDVITSGVGQLVIVGLAGVLVGSWVWNKSRAGIDRLRHRRNSSRSMF